MQNGDLSSWSAPRVVIVFENLIGFLPDDRREDWRKLSRAGRWDDVAALFDLDPMMLRKITWLSFKRSMTIDVATFCGPAAWARALERLFDREHVPIRIVTATTAERLARTTSFEPDIVTVYDGNPGHALAYGPKGCYLSDHRQLGG